MGATGALYGHDPGEGKSGVAAACGPTSEAALVLTGERGTRTSAAAV